MSDNTRVESDGARWYLRDLHIDVDATLDELEKAGFGEYQSVGRILMHLNDDMVVSVAAQMDHSLSYDGRHVEEDNE